MVESTSMVSGSVPGPAPACQARFSSSPLTTSSWRTWPQLKARRNVPLVAAAATQWPRTVAVSPARRTATSLIHFAPAISAATSADPFSPTLAAPATPPRSTRSSRSSRTPRRCISVAARRSPALATRCSSSKLVRMVSRVWDAVTCQVPPTATLAVSKTIVAIGLKHLSFCQDPALIGVSGLNTGARSAPEGVAQRVEEALPHLGRAPVALLQLLVQGAVVGADVGGDGDVDDAQLVAAPAAAHMGHAHPGDLHHLAVLGARGDLDLMLAVDGGHGDAVAEDGLGHGHRQLVEEVLAAPHQVRVRGDAEADVQVTAAAAPRSRLALPLVAEGDVLVDARRDGDVELLALLDAALAVAGGARLLDDPTLAVAARAGGDVDHLAEDALHGAAHLATAAAVGAG